MLIVLVPVYCRAQNEAVAVAPQQLVLEIEVYRYREEHGRVDGPSLEAERSAVVKINRPIRFDQSFQRKRSAIKQIGWLILRFCCSNGEVLKR